MFSKPIEIWDAVITAIHHKVEDGAVQSRILVTGTLNPDLADELGTRTLVFASNGTPKGGFSKLELDTGCAAFRAVFEADPSLKQSFELISGDSTDRYIVERGAEGVLRLKLRLNYHGDPHEVLAYVGVVGSGESMLKIVPLQTTIDNAKASKEDDKEEAPPVPKETVRQAMTGSRVTKRARAGVQ